MVGYSGNKNDVSDNKLRNKRLFLVHIIIS